MPTNFLNFGPELDAIFADSKKLLAAQTTQITGEATFETKVLAALGALATALDQQTEIIKADFATLTLAQQATNNNLGALNDATATIITTLRQILALASPPSPPVALALDVATDFIGDKIVNEQLPNNVTRWRNILVKDIQGNPVPADPADTFTVVSNNLASLNAVVGPNPNPAPAFNGKPAVGYNALVQASAGVSFTVSDADGLQSFTETVDIVENVTPVSISLDPSAPFDQSQPVPTAPGP